MIPSTPRPVRSRPGRGFLFLVAGLLLAAGVCLVAGEPPAHVVLMVADDLGAMDLGVAGSRFHRTPNLDRLAREGVRFTQAYSACTVCSPTRAALMTGKHPARLRITDWIAGAPPLKGTWIMSTPAARTNAAPARCGAEPGPAEA